MMTAFRDALLRATTLTFDCYGTLIDWDRGLRNAFVDAFGPAIRGRLDELYDVYNRIEAEVESGPYRPYREIIRETLLRVGAHFGMGSGEVHENALVDGLPSWEPFPDTNDALVLLKQRYRLGVLSNIDRDLFKETARHFSVAFDFVITAEDVRGYKPGTGHFQRVIAEHGPASNIVHVAQSLFHDGVPAREQGLAFVWINRYKHGRSGSSTPLAEFRDLKSLAKAVSEL
ncbi:MAG: HAD-IA family hydrolase [Phycisphaerae bacterium]|nr:HAD-IA family hydrolase [Phycisphaerae bacterium]